MATTEYLPVCDAENRVIGRAERRVIHAQGLRHRAVHVVVLNAKGEIFLQRRGPGKDTWPGLWDTSVGGHINCDETPDQTAKRELKEELGLEGELRKIGEHSASEETGWEFITVYEHRAEREPRWDGVEITDGCWRSPDEIERQLASGELETPPSFRATFRLWRSLQRSASASR